MKAGTTAPDFRLPANPEGDKLSPSELHGKNLVLVFYPADWSPVCGDQLTLYSEMLPRFTKRGAELVGISVDGVWCHRAYSKDRHLRFPLLADFEPKGEVARRYGAYREKESMAERALFVINRDGVIHWSYVSPIDVNPGAEGILDALESLPETERTPHDQSERETTRPGF